MPMRANGKGMNCGDIMHFTLHPFMYHVYKGNRFSLKNFIKKNHGLVHRN